MIPNSRVGSSSVFTPAKFRQKKPLNEVDQHLEEERGSSLFLL